MRRRSRARSSAGFTLIELLVALVISGIVVGSVFQLLLGQGRFARYQGAREEVQQNARAALEIISAELRGVPPGAIITAETHRIRYRLPRAWGVLCENATEVTGTIWVRFPAGVFPADFPASSSTSWGVAVRQLVTAPNPWAFVTSTTNPGGTSPCSNVGNLGAAVPAGGVFERPFSGAGFVTMGTALAGTQVFVYQDVEYDISTSGVPGLWIRRNTQPTPQPMAGPVPAASGANAGLRFTYRNAMGGSISAPVAAGDLENIALIGLQVVTSSSAQLDGAAQRDIAFTEVYLRNRN